MVKATSIPMGNSIFVTWPQIDNIFDAWAKSYFGDHVKGSGERDETDCYVAILGLKESDNDKFTQLFDQYDTEHDYDSSEEFCTGEQQALLPDCLTCIVMSEALKCLGMNSVGMSLATAEGVFFMENKLNYFEFVVSRTASEIQPDKTPLEQQIQSASNRTVVSQPMNQGKVKEPVPEPEF